VGAGLRHLGTQPELHHITVAVASAMLVFGFFESVLFVIVESLAKPTSFFGVILTVQGVGALLGGATGAAVQRRTGQAGAVALGLGAMGAAAVVMTTRSVALVLTAAVLLGAGMSWYAVGFATALQRRTPARLQGRVTASAYFVVDLPQTASIALGAWLVAFLDHRAILVAVAAVPCAAALRLMLQRWSWQRGPRVLTGGTRRRLAVRHPRGRRIH
jgi:MFS family permease